MNLLPGKGKKQEAVKTEDGTIKISPPKRTDNKDLLSEKEISWWDFIKNKYADNSYTQHIKQTYHISFLELISNNNSENFIISLRQNIQNLRRIIINEINCLDYDLLLNMTIN